jgi:hypothetical protein
MNMTIKIFHTNCGGCGEVSLLVASFPHTAACFGAFWVPKAAELTKSIIMHEPQATVAGLTVLSCRDCFLRVEKPSTLSKSVWQHAVKRKKQGNRPSKKLTQSKELFVIMP